MPEAHLIMKFNSDPQNIWGIIAFRSENVHSNVVSVGKGYVKT